MHFPIPGRKAKQAAQDLASDVRKLAVDAMKLAESLQKGEGTPKDKAEYDLAVAQIRSMCDVVFVCAETGKEFKVGDFVTSRREFLAMQAKNRLAAAYSRLNSFLVH